MSMKIHRGPSWDPDEEPYEDFLEKLPEEYKIALAEGDAFLAKPVDGLDVLKTFFESAEEGDGYKRWTEFLDSIETEEDAKQKISEVGVLGDVATRVAIDIAGRMRKLHTAGCEKCQKRNTKKKRAFDAAKQAFLDAMGSDTAEDEWDDENVDPDAWRKDA